MYHAEPGSRWQFFVATQSRLELQVVAVFAGHCTLLEGVVFVQQSDTAEPLL